MIPIVSTFGLERINADGTAAYDGAGVARSAAGDENGSVRGMLIFAMVAMLAASPSPLAPQNAPVTSEKTSGARRQAAPPAETKVDINHASMAELMKISGMTPSWASRIVRFRPYRAKTDLLDRGVLPSAVYDRIKDSVIAHRVKRQD
ncbi:MAG TPA: helix-hairpin-helix domain-containing protein [Terracidiphilus sp.]|nr:helix-hairpin-helix domain-containing protein [Terracidiphilus sp.]